MKRLALARGKHLRLLECIQKPRRTRFAAVRPGTVDLHDLLHGVRFAGIFNLDAHGHIAAVQSHAHRAELCLAVAEAIAERVQDASTVGVKIAVAKEAVELLGGKTERFQRLRPAERELAGRADLAGYDICQRVARFLPGKAEEDDCAAASCFHSQLHVAWGGNDERDAGERTGHFPDHVLLKACELRVIVRRRARQNDHSRVVHGGELLHAETSERHLASFRMLERPRAVFVRQKRVRLDGGFRREAVENSNLPPRLHAGKTGRRKDLADAEDGDARGLVF